MARRVHIPRKRDRVAFRLFAAFALSLLANALAAWIVFMTGAFEVGRPTKITPVALHGLSASQWAQNRAAAPAATPHFATPSPQAPPPEMPQQAGKIVELPPVVPGAKNEPPKESKFLAERNQHVEKETVSKYARGHAGPVLAVPQAGSAGQPASGGGETEKRQERLSLARPQSLSGTGATRPEGEGSADRNQAPRDGGPTGSNGRGKSPDLSVGPESLARIIGGNSGAASGAPNMDGYGDVQEGEFTALNTREFKYATYMNQIRRRIGESWYPKIDEVMRARDPQGKSFFYTQRTVTLSITLDLSGRVTDLGVVESSHVDFFDRVAIASVREAEPFLNPPPGMFAQNGIARIPFSFTVYPADRHSALFWQPPLDTP